MTLRRSASLVLVLVLAGCTSARHQAVSPTTTTGVPTPATTLPSAPTSTQAAPGTRVSYAAPVDMLGHPVPGLSVAAAVSGSCESGSDSIGNVEVYRCIAGNSIYDPCWADAAGGVLCMETPWVTSVQHLSAAGVTSGVNVTTTDLDYPWGVELTSGARCVAAQGAHDTFESKTIDYYCSGGGQSGLSLLRGVNRSTPYWTYQTVVHNGSSAAAGPAVSVVSAWFAGPAPVNAAPCQGPSISVTSSSTAPSSGMAWMAFQNNSSSPCSLDGFPGVAVLDASGNQIAQVGRTPNDGTPLRPVVIPPGGAASAVLQGDPDYPTKSCPTYSQLLVTPPNTTTSRTVSVDRLAICPNAQIGIVGVEGRPLLF